MLNSRINITDEKPQHIFTSDFLILEKYQIDKKRYCDQFVTLVWGTKRRNKRQKNMDKIDLVNFDVIFVPIAESDHWNLLAVCNLKKAIDHLTTEWIEQKEHEIQ